MYLIKNLNRVDKWFNLTSNLFRVNRTESEDEDVRRDWLIKRQKYLSACWIHFIVFDCGGYSLFFFFFFVLLLHAKRGWYLRFMDRIIGDKFKLGRKIGSGSFGEIYLGLFLQSNSLFIFLLLLFVFFSSCFDSDIDSILWFCSYSYWYLRDRCCQDRMFHPILYFHFFSCNLIWICVNWIELVSVIFVSR